MLSGARSDQYPVLLVADHGGTEREVWAGGAYRGFPVAHDRVLAGPGGDVEDPAHRGAYHALAVRVMTRGNWVQIAGIRYVWSHADGSLLRQPVGPIRPQARMYTRA